MSGEEFWTIFVNSGQILVNVKYLKIKASWSLRSRITGSALKLNFWVKHIHYSGKKTWSNFGANLLHPNCDLSNITGCPIRLWLFHAKLSYYLLQYLLKLNIYYSHFLFLFLRMCGLKKFLMRFIFNFKSHDEIRINAKINHKIRILFWGLC